MTIKINAADVIKAQQFKKEMSVEDFSKTPLARAKSKRP